jgi:hypothetical protein
MNVGGSKAKRDDGFGSVKRRRTTPPDWTGIDVYNNVDNENDDDDDSRELVGNDDEAHGNLVSIFFFLYCCT